MLLYNIINYIYVIICICVIGMVIGWFSFIWSGAISFFCLIKVVCRILLIVINVGVFKVIES